MRVAITNSDLLSQSHHSHRYGVSHSLADDMNSWNLSAFVTHTHYVRSNKITRHTFCFVYMCGAGGWKDKHSCGWVAVTQPSHHETDVMKPQFLPSSWQKKWHRVPERVSHRTTYRSNTCRQVRVLSRDMNTRFCGHEWGLVISVSLGDFKLTHKSFLKAQCERFNGI